MADEVGTLVRHIAVAGASGFIGTALTTHLEACRYRVTGIGRGGNADVRWDPAHGQLDPQALVGVDVVVNLAGEPIDQRWTAGARRRILDSRVQTTGLLARTMAALAGGPQVLVNMSAIGVYGDRGDDVLDESSPLGAGFLADVVRAWEAAADPAREAGLRVVHPRTGVVLHPAGGALRRLLPFFKFGVGGPVGSGQQWMSWIGLPDVARGLAWLATESTLGGIVNLTAPRPVTSAEFARALGRVLRRPAVFPIPAFGVKALYGQMGEETVVAGQRVLPRRLLDAGFEFLHADVEGALRAVLADA